MPRQVLRRGHRRVLRINLLFTLCRAPSLTCSRSALYPALGVLSSTALVGLFLRGGVAGESRTKPFGEDLYGSTASFVSPSGSPPYLPQAHRKRRTGPPPHQRLRRDIDAVHRAAGRH